MILETDFLQLPMYDMTENMWMQPKSSKQPDPSYKPELVFHGPLILLPRSCSILLKPLYDELYLLVPVSPHLVLELSFFLWHPCFLLLHEVFFPWLFLDLQSFLHFSDFNLQNKDHYGTTVNKTSILKVLLKQYMSPTGPNKYWRGITPTKPDNLKLDLF